MKKVAAPLTTKERDQLVAIFLFLLVAGYYSPLENSTVSVVAVTSAVGAAWSDYSKDKLASYANLTTYQRVIGWGAIGAMVGIGIDTILRPKLNPERI